MQATMGLYVLVFMILGLVIYHSIFNIWYFNLTKALIGELFGALMFGVLMAEIALKFWPIALVIVILIGLALAAKVSNPIGKTIIGIVVVIVAIFTAFTGIKFNKQLKEDKKWNEFYDSLGSSPVDPKIHIVTNDNDYLFAPGKTYVCIDSGDRTFINVKYSEDRDPSFGYLEFNITYKRGTDDLYVDGEFFRGVNSEDEPLKYYDLNGRNYEMAEITDENHFVISGGQFDEEEWGGKYSLANEEDISYLQENMSDLLADRIKEHASSGDEMSQVAKEEIIEEKTNEKDDDDSQPKKEESKNQSSNNNSSGTVYEKNEYEYVTWSEDGNTTLVLQYDDPTSEEKTGRFEIIYEFYDPETLELAEQKTFMGSFFEDKQGKGDLYYDDDAGTAYYTIIHNKDHYEIAIYFENSDLYLLESDWAYQNVG